MSAEMAELAARSTWIGFASMGPRSDERGNGLPQAARSGPRPASMGPRSDERGNLFRNHARDGRRHASMGPRSDERGNIDSKLRTKRIILCFNGAALR